MVINALKAKRQRIVELNMKDSLKPPHRVIANLAAFIDSPTHPQKTPISSSAVAV
jgi:hypothetical protein